MKLPNLEALKKELKGQKKGAIAILSPDFAERRAALALIPQSRTLSAAVSLEELRKAVTEPSLFGGEGLLHIEGIEELSSESRKWLEGEIQEGRPLLLSGTALAANSSLYKKLAESALLLEYTSKEKPKEREARFLQEIAAFAEKRGVALPSDVQRRLVKEGPEELTALFSELEKLFTYVHPKKTVSMHDLEQVAILSPRGTIWQLGDLILERSPKAVKLATDLFNEDGEVIPLLRVLRQKIEKGYRVSSILAGGGDVSSEYPNLYSTTLQMELNRIQSFGMPRLKRALLALNRAEWDAKNSASDPLLLLQKLLMEIMT